MTGTALVLRELGFFYLFKHMFTLLSTCIYSDRLLCGCGNWSLTPRKQHRLRVFQNRLLRKTFGPKRSEVRAGWMEEAASFCMICTSHQIYSI
jgi:hypothetical protein